MKIVGTNLVELFLQGLGEHTAVHIGIAQPGEQITQRLRHVHLRGNLPVLAHIQEESLRVLLGGSIGGRELVKRGVHILAAEGLFQPGNSPCGFHLTGLRPAEGVIALAASLLQNSLDGFAILAAAHAGIDTGPLLCADFQIGPVVNQPAHQRNMAQ